MGRKRAAGRQHSRLGRLKKSEKYADIKRKVGRRTEVGRESARVKKIKEKQQSWGKYVERKKEQSERSR